MGERKLELAMALPLATLIGVGVPMVASAIRHAFMRKKQEKAFEIAKQIFARELEPYSEEEKRLYFNTFRTMSPSLATDPLLVGTFLKQTLAMKAIDPTLIRNIRELRFGEEVTHRIMPQFTIEAAKILLKGE